jgi:uncharacterized Zn finger protein (UPF0148 family)
MTFQFLCPHGHLLEGDESQQGQPCDCPTCGVRFLIPAAPGAPPAAAPPEPAFPDVTAGAGNQETATVDPTKKEPRLLHIPCPQGHELETPEEMIGQDVLCPLCGEQFNLQYKNSVEYKKEKEAERERRERKMAEAWFTRAIIAAVIVVLGLIVLLVLAASD